MGTRLEQHMQRLRILWAAILAALPVYAVVVMVVPPQRQPDHTADVLVWLLGAVAAVELVAVAPIMRLLMARGVRAFEAGQGPEPLLASHFASSVVGWAMAEAVGVMGVVAYFVTGRAPVCWAFLAVAAAGLVALRPRLDPMDRLLAASGPRVEPIEP